MALHVNTFSPLQRMLSWFAAPAAFGPKWIAGLSTAIIAVEVTDFQNFPGYGAFGVVMLVSWRILNKALRDSTSEYQQLAKTHKEEKEELHDYYLSEIDRLRGALRYYEDPSRGSRKSESLTAEQP